jgi:hypothetical protein
MMPPSPQDIRLTIHSNLLPQYNTNSARRISPRPTLPVTRGTFRLHISLHVCKKQLAIWKTLYSRNEKIGGDVVTQYQWSKAKGDATNIGVLPEGYSRAEAHFNANGIKYFWEDEEKIKPFCELSLSRLLLAFGSWRRLSLLPRLTLLVARRL